jgi:hypothetical protein
MLPQLNPAEADPTTSNSNSLRATYFAAVKIRRNSPAARFLLFN